MLKYIKYLIVLYSLLFIQKANAEFDYKNYVPTLTGLYETSDSSINSLYNIEFASPKMFYYELNFHKNGTYLSRINNADILSYDIVGYFFGLNSTENGTAIYNSGTINNITADFVNNVSSGVGVTILNTGTIGNITGDFIGNTSLNAVIHNTGTINSITGNFINNHTTYSSSPVGFAGAISNYSSLTTSIGTIKGNFIGNYMDNARCLGAGAIYLDNDLTTNTISGNFVNNHVYTTYTKGFTGSASGAITGIKLVLLADNAGYEFTGNYVSGNGIKFYNSIVQAGAANTFNVINNGTWTLNDNYIAMKFNGANGKWFTILSSESIFNIIGDGTGTVNFNSEIVNVINLNVNNATLKFGTYNHNDSDAYNNISRGMFISGNQWLIDPTVADYFTALSLTDATFDIANGYVETITLTGLTSDNSKIILDTDVINKTSDIISVHGNVNGTTDVIINANADTDLEIRDEVLFAESINDNTGDENSFNIYRVYGSSYLYDSVYRASSDTSNNWYLTRSQHSDVVAEVPAYLALHNAFIEQTRDLVLGARRNTIRGNHKYNTWAAPVYLQSKTTAPIDMKSNTSGIEAGIDIRHKNKGRFGLFGSYRNGEHDVSGTGIIYSQTGSDINTESFGGGLYYRYDSKKLPTVFTSIYGSKLNANIKTNDNVKISANGLQLGVGLETSYDYKMSKKWHAYPELGIQYDIFKLNSFSDTYGKTVSADDWGYGEIELGTSFEYRILKNTGIYAKPMITYGFANGNETEISNLGTYDTIYNRAMARLEIGARTMIRKKLSGYLYGRYTGNCYYSGLSTGLGINYKF